MPGEARAVRICTQDRCQTGRRDATGVLRAGMVLGLRKAEARDGRRMELRVAVLDSRGRRITGGRANLRLARQQPNGPRCGPVCFAARAVLDGRTGRLEVVRSPSAG